MTKSQATIIVEYEVCKNKSINYIDRLRKTTNLLNTFYKN